jgi:hypothetical protein
VIEYRSAARALREAGIAVNETNVGRLIELAGKEGCDIRRRVCYDEAAKAKRAEIIKAGLSEGMSWKAIARAVIEAEGRTPRGACIGHGMAAWWKRHGEGRM